MPARNSDGTIRNGRAPAKLTMRSVVARWVEAETIRRKQMGLSWDMIAEQITQVGRGLAQPAVRGLPARRGRYIARLLASARSWRSRATCARVRSAGIGI